MNKSHPRHRAPIPRDVVATEVAIAAAAEPEVLAAYLFGSTARGTAGPLSDIDVGVLVSGHADAFEVVGRLSDALSRRLGTSNVDVVSLAAASFPLRYRVVRDGVLVACRDQAARERFTAETVLGYLDFSPVRDRALAGVGGAILRER